MSARAAAKPLAGLVLGGTPRVNLIPPEVGERAARRRTRGFLVVAVIAVVGLVAAGYALATIRAIGAQFELDAAQARTQELLAQRAEYADTAALTQAVGVIEQTRIDATSGEIVWADVFDEISGVLGTNAYVEWSGGSPPPWSAPIGGSTSTIALARAGALTLVFDSVSPADSTALYRRILALDVTAEMSYDLIELPSGQPVYRTTIVILLADEAVSGRFAETEGDDDEGQ